MLSKCFFFRKSYPLCDNVGKIWRRQTGHRWQYGASAFAFQICEATETHSE